MANHLTPEEIADALETDPRAVLHAAVEVDVPVYHGQIDKVLFAEALEAADHHLAPRARSAFLD
jgi:hypothetical protein